MKLQYIYIYVINFVALYVFIYRSPILFVSFYIVSFISRLRVIFGLMPEAVKSDVTHIKLYTQKELIKLFKPHNQDPVMVPTSFSINPFKPGTYRLPSNNINKALDDHLLFFLKINKTN